VSQSVSIGVELPPGMMTELCCSLIPHKRSGVSCNRSQPLCVCQAIYACVSKSFRTGRLERELQMIQRSVS